MPSETSAPRKTSGEPPDTQEMSPAFRPLNAQNDDRLNYDAAERSGNWYSRGYLPHFSRSNLAQSVTFRLFDSIPNEKLKQIEQQLKKRDEDERNAERRKKIEELLDRGLGNAWLEKPTIADLVQDSLLYHDEEKYVLHAWVVMPNHVHVLVTTNEKYSLDRVVHSWKSYTASEANRRLNRSGSFWQRDYYDRYIRDNDHFWNTVRYIELNPVKANLCEHPADWSWSSASYRREHDMRVMDYDG